MGWCTWTSFIRLLRSVASKAMPLFHIIFGMNTRLMYGPQLQRYNRTSTNYLQYRLGGVPLHRACRRGRATKPYSLGGEGMGVRFIQAQDHQVTIRSPRIVNECSLTRSILTKKFTVDFMQELYYISNVWIWFFHYSNYRVWWLISVLAVRLWYYSFI